MQMRVADYIAKYLEQAGARSSFMLTGGMMMHLMDAAGRIPAMPYYCNHHEQASAMAADVYARLSGRLGLCLATSGPGATNLLTGLVGAYQDSTPVVFLTGQCKKRETVRASGISGLRQYGFLEVDIVPIVESVTKYAHFLDDPLSVRYHIEKAVYLALHGRPGPVLLDVPLDIQGAPIESDDLVGFDPAELTPASEPVDPAQVNALLDRIAEAKRPLLLAGHGVRCAWQGEKFVELVELLGIPVVTSFLAKDLLPYNHPLFTGHPGARGDRAGNYSVQTADLILTMGCSLHNQTTGYELDQFAPGAVKIQIELDPAIRQRENVGVQEKLAWDLRDCIPALVSALRERPKPQAPVDWIERCQAWKATYPVKKEPHTRTGPDGLVNLYDLTELLSQLLPSNAVLMTDAGQPHPVLSHAFRLTEGQRYITSGSLAEMGFAIPGAIGAAVAAPDRPVFVVSGDGSFQTNIQELQTLVHYGFDIRIFVINNGGYLSIRNTQKNFFQGFYVGSTPESGVSLPDVSKICTAYGITYIRCNNNSELQAAVEQVIATRGPVICEVMCQTDQRVMPAVPSFKLPDGSMRSKALHEIAPEVGDDALKMLLAFEG